MTMRCGAGGQASPLGGAEAIAKRSYGGATLRGAERASVSGNPLHVPGLAALTGFSRSSTSRPDAGLLGTEESPLRPLDLSWDLRMCITMSDSGDVPRRYPTKPGVSPASSLCSPHGHPARRYPKSGWAIRKGDLR